MIIYYYNNRYEINKKTIGNFILLFIGLNEYLDSRTPVRLRSVVRPKSTHSPHSIRGITHLFTPL